jgi:hypothetical protein
VKTMLQLWDGYPRDPESSGWHWLLDKEGGETRPAWWWAEEKLWLLSHLDNLRHLQWQVPSDVVAHFRYWDRCMKPVQVAGVMVAEYQRGFRDGWESARAHYVKKLGQMLSAEASARLADEHRARGNGGAYYE